MGQEWGQDLWPRLWELGRQVAEETAASQALVDLELVPCSEPRSVSLETGTPTCLEWGRPTSVPTKSQGGLTFTASCPQRTVLMLLAYGTENLCVEV